MHNRIILILVLAFLISINLSYSYSENTSGLFSVKDMAGIFFTYKNDWIQANKATLSKGDIVRFDGGILSEGQHKKIAVLNPYARCALMFEYSGEDKIVVSGFLDTKLSKGRDFLYTLALNSLLIGVCTNSRELLAQYLRNNPAQTIKSLSLLLEMNSEDIAILKSIPNLSYLNILGFQTTEAQEKLIKGMQLSCITCNGELRESFDGNLQAALELKLKHAYVIVSDVKHEEKLLEVLNNAHSVFIEWRCKETPIFVCANSFPQTRNISISVPYSDIHFMRAMRILRSKHSLNFFGLILRINKDESLSAINRKIDCKLFEGLSGVSVECVATSYNQYIIGTGVPFEFKSADKCELEYLDLRYLIVGLPQMTFPKLTDLFVQNMLIANSYKSHKNCLPNLKSIFAVNCRNPSVLAKGKTLSLSSVGYYDKQCCPVKVDTYVLHSMGYEYKDKEMRDFFSKRVKRLLIYPSSMPIWEGLEDWKSKIFLPENVEIIVFGSTCSKINDIPVEVDLSIIAPKVKELSGKGMNEWRYKGSLCLDRSFLD